MANTNINVTKVQAPNEIGEITFAAVSGTSDNFVVPVDFKDGKTVLIVSNENSAQGTITVKAGNGKNGVNDLALKVGANKTAVFQLDSMAYMNASGEHKGKILIGVSATTLKLAVATFI